MKNFGLCFLFLLQLTFCMNGQSTASDTINSLVKKGYDELRVDFRKLPIDTLLSIPFAKAFLKKAQFSKDTLRIAEGYHILSNLTDVELALKYADSIIYAMKDRPKTAKYPAFAYLQKGRLLYRRGDYKGALDYYFKCLDMAENSDNSLVAGVNFNIGLINSLIGNKKDALVYFNKYDTYLNNSTLPNKDYYQTRIIYAKSDVFVFSGQIDSALYFSKKGEDLTLKNNDSLYYSRFVLNTGIALYQQMNYKKSLNHLLGVKKSIEKDIDPTIKSLYNLSLAKVLIGMDRQNEAIEYLKKSELIILETNEVLPELLETFVLLKNHYSAILDNKNQLATINSLLKYDSVVDTYANSLNSKIRNEYEIPKLIREKEVIISQLDKEKSSSTNILIVLIVLSLVLVFIIYFYMQRNKNLRLRFESVMQKTKEKENQFSIKKHSDNLGISQPLVDEILSKLAEFENGDEFTLKPYTLISLATKLDTNSSYLSKIINFHKQVNFASYLNNLKIDYAIKKLSTDNRFRLYTIKAIAQESGFNSGQSFTTAFYKKTGIYPSFFIKQLKKNDS